MTYRTPAQLEITQEEFAGLLRIMEHFRTAPPTLVPLPDAQRAIAIPESTPLGFSMHFAIGAVKPAAQAAKSWDCGSTACLAGHLSLHLQGVDVFVPHGTPIPITHDQIEIADQFTFNRGEVDPHDADEHGLIGDDNEGNIRSKALHPVFFPDIDYQDWDKIGPHQAAKGIENFLTVGEPLWHEITGVPRDSDG